MSPSRTCDACASRTHAICWDCEEATLNPPSHNIGVAVSPGPASFAPLLFAGDLDRALAELTALGMTCVELSIRDPAEIDAGAVRAQVNEAGLRCSAIATGQACLADGLCLSSADGRTRASAINRFCAEIELASALDADVILGGVRGSLGGDPARRPAAVDAIAACAAEAAARRVTILIEPINRYETDFVNSCEQGLELLEEVGSESLRLLLDTFHMNIEEASLTDAIRAAGPQLGYFHVADSNRLAPGLGHIEFGELLDALHEIHYDGPIVAEILPHPGDQAALEAAAGFLQQITRVTEVR